MTSPSQHVPRVLLHELEAAAHALAEAIAVRDRVSLPVAAERAAVALRDAAKRAASE